MSHNRKRLFIFLIIFIYAFVAVVGFFIAFFIKGTFFHAKSVTPTPTPAPKIKVINKTNKATKTTPIPNPTDWQVYKSPNYKLKFSYPPSDTIKVTSYGFGVASLAIHKHNGALDFQILFMPKTLASTVGQDFASYYAMPNNTTKTIKNPLSNSKTTEKFTKIKNTSVNGLQAVDYRSVASNAQTGSPPEIGVFIKTGDNLVLISTGQKNKPKLEKMLSTFTYPD